MAYDLFLGICPTDLKVEAQTLCTCVHSSSVHNNYKVGEISKAKGVCEGNACTYNSYFKHGKEEDVPV